MRPHRKGDAISYRVEIGALLLALAVSVMVGHVRRRGRPGRRALLLPAALFLALAFGGAGLLSGCGSSPGVDVPHLLQSAQPGSALAALATLDVRGRAPKTGYKRAQFGVAWADVDHNGCDTRDDILRRDLAAQRFRSSTHGCVVVAGELADPYSGKTITFTKAQAAQIQIDHVVALSDAWQTGAQQLASGTRLAFANDPLNLLAVDGDLNQEKGDADAATWLPPRKAFRCAYVSRQIAVKQRYHLWVTAAERGAMARVLKTCPGEALP